MRPVGWASPDLAPARSWLACPACAAGLDLDAAALVCPAGHRFDLARQGYANLMARPSPRNADTAAMVEARDRFLRAEHFAPVAAAVTRRLRGCARVLDAGGGTGYYLATALDALPGALGVVTDVSVAAVRRAARAHPRMGALVADTWGTLPLRSRTVDAVCCVFAPRNPREFARVLRPGGRLVVVTPNPGHLAEARATLGLLGIEEGKIDHLRRATAGLLAPVAGERVTATLDLTRDEVDDVVGMGPNAFHAPAPAPAGLTVTLDVQVTTLSLALPDA